MSSGSSQLQMEAFSQQSNMLGTNSTQLTTSPELGNMIHIGGHHLIDSLLDGGFEFPTLVPQR